jgi:hypothetical protein
MRIEVNIKKKYFFSILAVVLLIGAGLFVYAFGGNSPQIMGHSAGELEITLANGTTVNFQTAITNNLIGGNGGGLGITYFIVPEILTNSNINKSGAWKTWSLNNVPNSASAVLVFGKWTLANAQYRDGMINVRNPLVGSTIPLLANYGTRSNEFDSSSGFAIVPVTNGDLEYQVLNYDVGSLELQVYGYMAQGSGRGSLPSPLYQCPQKTTCDNGQIISGDWASFGCVGQIGNVSQCYQVWYPGGFCANNCTLIN